MLASTASPQRRTASPERGSELADWRYLENSTDNLDGTETVTLILSVLVSETATRRETLGTTHHAAIGIHLAETVTNMNLKP